MTDRTTTINGYLRARERAHALGDMQLAREASVALARLGVSPVETAEAPGPVEAAVPQRTPRRRTGTARTPRAARPVTASPSPSEG